MDLRQQPLRELLNVVEATTSFRVFCDLQIADTTKVTVTLASGDPVRVLSEVVKEKELELAIYQDHIFVVPRETMFQVQLPEDYFVRRSGSGEEELSALAISLCRKNQKATSENKVYEVGEASRAVTGSVILSGNVSNYKTGDPMPGITIFNRDLSIGVTTDMDGNYEIELPAGRHDLFVQGVGLTDTKRQILLHTGGVLDIELEEQVYELDELTVSSERIANVRATTMGGTAAEAGSRQECTYCLRGDRYSSHSDVAARCKIGRRGFQRIQCARRFYRSEPDPV
ncbi:MAG: carboxypeptidase-like regulatory domain-containing protein [Bacteroides sp.]|nr:carboxypeptidase-like regulatory domain-containing protein [Bacteroides sp.]